MSKIVIIGAGPAGLSAGYQLRKQKNDFLILEKDRELGGLSKTIEFRGFLFDIGPHRWFSRNNELNQLVKTVLKKSVRFRDRYTPIYFQKQFYDYPVKPFDAIKKLGWRIDLAIIYDLLKVKIKNFGKKRDDESFEDYIENIFGRTLYEIFFKFYTEKVWGISCKAISREWAGQRIKGVNIFEIFRNALLPKKGQIKTFVDRFLYPDLGAGQFYQAMAKDFTEKLRYNVKIKQINQRADKIISLTLENGSQVAVSELISSMPITELVARLRPKAPAAVLQAAKRLLYRDIITVNLIIDKPRVTKCTWIYVQDRDLKIGRITEPKNWSKKMVADQKQTSLIVEIFATVGDRHWQMTDLELKKMVVKELEKLEFIKATEVVDYFVLRQTQAYPVYSIKYRDYPDYRENIGIVKKYLKKITNLQYIGRYGSYKYNNQDHSVLMGLEAGRNLKRGKRIDLDAVNTDDNYQESQKIG